MAQINIDLIKSLTKHRKIEKVPIVGLRTGFLRAWLFVAFKVLLIASILHGSGMVKSFQDNVALLDQYFRNDFDVVDSSLALVPQAHKQQLTDDGIVASANTGAEQGNAVNNYFQTTNFQIPITEFQGIDLNYLNQLVQYNIASSIDSGYIVGSGTAMRGCLHVNDLGFVAGTNRNCRSSGGGSGGGGSSTSLNMGAAISNATVGSVLFAGAGGTLEQDNSNFFWDNTSNYLGIGTASPSAKLQVVSTSTTHTIGDSDNVDGQINYGTGNYFNDGPYTHNIRVYAYETVGASRVYSSTFATAASDVVDDGNSDNSYSITWTWDAVAGADGYRILKSDNYSGYNFDYGYDTTDTFFEDDACGSVCFDDTLANVSTTTLDTFDSPAITTTGFVGIGNTDPDALLSVGPASEFQVDDDGIITSDALSGSGTRCLQTDNNGIISIASAGCSSGGITIGTTTITSGTSGRVLYNNAGVVGEMTTTGSGTTLALSASPTFTGAPVLAAATYTTLSGGNINVTSGNAYRYNSVNVIRASTGDSNYYFGNSGPGTLTWGNNNIGMGAGALGGLTVTTPGSYNVAIGTSALAGAVTSNDNLAVGAFALNANTSGNANTAFGSSALTLNTEGSFNMGLGRQALGSNVLGSRNVAIGYQALFTMNPAAASNTRNTAVGDVAGYNITTGTNNTIIGGNTGLGITTGSSNTIIGANVSSLPIALSNTIILADGTGSIQARLGTTDMGDGVAGPVIIVGRNNNATNTGAGSINFQSKAGTAGYVWQDNAGNVRINTSAPTNALDTSGTVVGTQASVRSTKQDITDYTDYAGALQMVADAPLHTFRYIKDVQGYGTNSPLAKERIGYIADEVPGAFMWGNSIDQVSVNGILMASVKELNNKVNTLALGGDTNIVMAQPTLGNAPLVLHDHLYLSGDSIGQAKILEGDTSVRINFTKAYQYDPIVTATPNSRVGSEYWVDDKDSSGFTIHIDDSANRDVTFDWHAFAGPSPKLSVSSGSSSGSSDDTISIEPEPAPEPSPDDGTVAGDSTPPPEDNTPPDSTEPPATSPPTE